MKFEYTYYTSDKKRHVGIVSARSRDDVYVKLKCVGVRPVAVNLAPGLVNKIQSMGTRGLLIFILSLTLAVVLPFAINESRRVDISESTERHQIYGDEGIINEAVGNNWARVLNDEGDRFLSQFAQPGVLPMVEKATAQDISAIKKCMLAKTRILPDDLMEYRQIKSIVMGIKKEMIEYISAGGNVNEFVVRLFERQRLENAIYKRYEKELDGEQDESVWISRNAELREMGIKLLKIPPCVLEKNMIKYQYP